MGIDIVYGDSEHFGEPLIALHRWCEFREVEKILNNALHSDISLCIENVSIHELLMEKDRKDRKLAKGWMLPMSTKNRSNSHRSGRKRKRSKQLMKRQWNVQ